MERDMKWQDISTAPKNGHADLRAIKILLFSHSGHVHVGYWEAYQNAGWISADSGEPIKILTGEPTHWMPVPEPPKPPEEPYL